MEAHLVSPVWLVRRGWLDMQACILELKDERLALRSEKEVIFDVRIDEIESVSFSWWSPGCAVFKIGGKKHKAMFYNPVKAAAPFATGTALGSALQLAQSAGARILGYTAQAAGIFVMANVVSEGQMIAREWLGVLSSTGRVRGKIPKTSYRRFLIYLIIFIALLSLPLTLFVMFLLGKI